MIKKSVFIGIIIVFTTFIIINSCKDEVKNLNKISKKYNFDSTKIIIADTIIYDVVIKKSGLNDTWQDQSLKNVNQEYLINYVFNKIKTGELMPLDYILDSPLKTDEIKELLNREEFSLDKVSKIQFKETWYLTPDGILLEKKVISMIFAYELYNSDGELRGYRAAFKVNL